MTDSDLARAVLFADVAGSTRLYEQLGDAAALAAINNSLAVVEKVASGHGGRLVKTIGDEAMVVFPTADQAAAAATEIQNRMAEASPAGASRVAFRIGFHYGAAIESAGDVYGDSVNVAARMVALAKREQVLLTAAAARALSASFAANLRELDVLSVKGKAQDIGIVELIWQDASELTALATRPRFRSARLALRHGALAFELTQASAALTLGREAGNDIVIADKHASRLHARIERRRDRFVLIDQSSNGTYVTVEGEREIHLRREELMLRGRGRISFGHAYAADPAETVEFEYAEGEPV